MSEIRVVTFECAYAKGSDCNSQCHSGLSLGEYNSSFFIHDTHATWLRQRMTKDHPRKVMEGTYGRVKTWDLDVMSFY